MRGSTGGGWFVLLLALATVALVVVVSIGVGSLAGALTEHQEEPASTTYEVQVCYDGRWSEEGTASAAPSGWATVKAEGDCGVRWREVTP